MKDNAVKGLNLLFLLVSLGLASCATKIRIRTLEPAPVNLGATKDLSVVQTTGRRSARELVINELIKQAREDGHFKVIDQSEKGLQVSIAGRNAKLVGGKLKNRQLGVRIDVLEYQTGTDNETQTFTDSQGKERTRTVKYNTGNALLSVTLFNSKRQAFISEKEYEGTYRGESDEVSRDQARELAAQNAVTRFLDDITPQTITRAVRLDEDDKSQKAIIETAANGNLSLAAQDLQNILKQNENNASATYNLAVIKDALGDYKAALQLYDKALSLGNKDYYSSARAACAKRIANQEALSL